MKKYCLVGIILVILLVSGCCQDDHDDEHEQGQEHSEDQLTKSQIWGFGILGGIIISLIGFIAALILLTVKKCCSDNIFGITIKFLFSLACGALLGDSIVHILAQAFANQHLLSLIVSLIFIATILLFVILERIMESFGFSHTHWHQQSHKSHVSNQPNPEDGEEQIPKAKIKQRPSSQLRIQSSAQLNEQCVDQKSNCCKRYLRQYSNKGSMGYINLIGSLIHNFIDGLALGIAFSTGKTAQIIPVGVAIIAHEIPRELGDVAILLKNDFTEVQTIVCNGTINFFSLIGVIIGLAATNLNEEVKQYILVFVAANFVYIAADIWKHMFKNKEGNVKGKNFLEFAGFSIGVGSMFALTLLETGDDH